VKIEPGQYLAVNFFLILKNAHGTKGLPPTLKLQQCNRGVTCFIVVGQGKYKQRFSHAVDAAIYRVTAFRVKLRVTPVELPPFRRYLFLYESAEIFHESRLHPLPRQVSDVADFQYRLNEVI
jgi:type III secretory pathway component EscR